METEKPLKIAHASVITRHGRQAGLRKMNSGATRSTVCGAPVTSYDLVVNDFLASYPKISYACSACIAKLRGRPE